MGDDRLFPPTQKKLKRLKKEGRLFRSNALSAPISFLAFLLLFKAFSFLSLGNGFLLNKAISLKPVFQFFVVLFLVFCAITLLQGKWSWVRPSQKDNEEFSFSFQTPVKMIFSALKVGVLILVGEIFFKKTNFAESQLYSDPRCLGNLLYEFAFLLGIGWLIVGIVEWGASKFLYHKAIFMSAQELKDEKRNE